ALARACDPMALAFPIGAQARRQTSRSAEKPLSPALACDVFCPACALIQRGEQFATTSGAGVQKMCAQSTGNAGELSVMTLRIGNEGARHSSAHMIEPLAWQSKQLLRRRQSARRLA